MKSITTRLSRELSSAATCAIGTSLRKLWSHTVLPFFCLCIVFVSACSTTSLTGSEPSGDAQSEVEFIDLDTFDATLANNMRVKSDRFKVFFPNQSASVNDLPDRLQTWLSAVHKHGGGVSVETEEGYVRKDLMSVIGIMAAGYNLAKRSIPALMGKQYKAVIVLGDGDGVIEHVSFIRL